MRILVSTTLAITLCLMMLPVAAAASKVESAPRDDAAAKADPVPASTSASQAGMRVYVDPATGRRLTNPTAEQRANAAALDRDNPAFSTSSEGLQERPLPGGGVLVHLDGRFQSAVMVRRGADGRLHQRCNNPIHEKLGAGHSHAVPVAVERDDR